MNIILGKQTATADIDELLAYRFKVINQQREEIVKLRDQLRRKNLQIKDLRRQLKEAEKFILTSKRISLNP